ncbi:PL29 family lyase N-terminal domain-containing protein [uncultured Alistipes sp.]|uniref:PL29 family lyase N-terminal domain-containing protein n=1 Tax=uncultured Alistipes sp. TaxID=538949 RepID=UPI002637AC15|nr:PL29 family lyase N-terminal domain-containing protein [uncultured Alistipes sp.]
MKKLFMLFAIATLVCVGCSDEYDDSALRNDLNDLENRVAKLEELCKQMNTNISSLQKIVEALEKNDYVTNVTPVMQNGKEIGYTIVFSKSNPITIYHGKDGQDGGSSTTPSIGVKQDTDGIYYWTLNGEWLTDDHGDKIKAEGADGDDGTDGEDGITPKFKIENDYWYISYNNGETWEQLGKATGEDGAGGDSMFTEIDYKTSTDYVIFTLADGTQIKLPTWSAFEALQRLCNETNTNLSSLQAIVTALQSNDYITSVDPLTENGKVVGYTIKFAKSNPIVIYNGKDGADGNTPVIGVKEDTDGIYYWTLNGEFIVVDGQKIKAQGADGSDGTDGTTPKLEIREGYWWISYDKGESWTQLGKATGEDGKDGESIKITQDENNVYFELADGTIITVSKSGSQSSDIIIFADKDVKKRCVGLWDTNGDGELSYEEAAAVTTIGNVFQDNIDIEFFNELKHFSGLTTLDANAFGGCSSLCNITIPANIETINVSAFKGCTSLMQVSFDENSRITTLEGSYIENSQSYGNNYPDFYNGVFADCKSLTTIHIPASVTEIKACAFQGCSSLSTVTFEKGSKLQIIGGGHTKHTHTTTGGSHWYSYKAYGAFADCTSLTSIEIPNSVHEIGICAFKGCTNLQTITFQKNIQIKELKGAFESYYKDESDRLGVFQQCSALSSIEIPASVELIDACAFAGCTNLSVVTFEQDSKLKEFGDGGIDHSGAFADCTSLRSIQIPAYVERIGAGTFYGCSQLSTVIFEPNSNLKIIGGINNNGAFTNCTALTTIKLPQSITSIETEAFKGCQKLIDIYCAALTPPAISYNTFTNISSAARFYVPTTSADIYKTAKEWEKYANQIVGYDF